MPDYLLQYVQSARQLSFMNQFGMQDQTDHLRDQMDKIWLNLSEGDQKLARAFVAHFPNTQNFYVTT